MRDEKSPEGTPPDLLGVKKGTKAIAGAIRKRKRTARAVLLVVLAIAGFQALLAAIMSIPATQEFLSHRIRATLEERLGVSVALGYVTVGLFPPRLQMEDVSIAHIEGLTGPQDALPFLETVALSVQNIDVGVDVLSLFSGTFQPVQSLALSDVRLAATDPRTLEQLWDLMGRQSPAPHPQADLWPELQRWIGLSPSRIRLENFEILLGQEQEPSYVMVLFEALEILKNRKNELVGVVSVGPSVLKHSRLPSPFAIKKLAIETRLRPDRALLLDRISVEASGAKGDLKGTVNLAPPGSPLTAELETDLEVDAGLLALVDVPSSGTIGVQGRFSILDKSHTATSGNLGTSGTGGKTLPTPPDTAKSEVAFEGRTRWRQLVLDGIEAFDGSAEVVLQGEELTAAQIQVNTPRGGALVASGRVALTGEIPFSASVKIENFPFTELMKGLGAPTDAMEFVMSAPEVRLEGAGLARNPDDLFHLDFRGEVLAKNLGVPSLAADRDPAYTLPDCRIDLGLRVSARLLDFDGSKVGCQETSALNLEVPSGRVNLDNGKTEFVIKGTDFDLTPVSYFANSATTGITKKFDGRIFSAGGNDGVTFDATLEAHNFSYDHIGPVRIKTRLRVNEEGLLLQDTSTQAEAEAAKGLQLQSRRIFISFGSKPSSFHLVGQGKLEALPHLVGPESTLTVPSDLVGTAERLEIDWDMDLSTSQVINAQANAKILNLGLGDFRSSEVGVDLNCAQTLCAQSFVRLRGASFGPVPKGTELGAMTLELRNLSSQKFHAVAVSSEVPLYVAAAGNPHALLNGRLEWVTAGPEHRLVPTGTLKLDDAVYGDQSLGNLVATAVLVDGQAIPSVRGPSRAHSGQSSSPHTHLSVSISSFFDAIAAQASIPVTGTTPMRVELTAKAFDPLFLVPQLRIERNLFSSLSGQASFEMPSLFAHPSGGADVPFLAGLRGRAAISEAMITTDGLSIASIQPIEVEMEGGILRMREAILTTPAAAASSGSSDPQGWDKRSRQSRVKARFQHNFLNSNGEGQLSGRIDVGMLSGLVRAAEHAEGAVTLDTKFIFKKEGTTLDGSVFIDAQRLGFNGFEPDFEYVQGRLLLSGDRVEIVRLSAKKGTGSLEVLGSLKLPLNAGADLPELGIRARFDKITSRFPAPIFRSVDTTLSGNLELSGTSKPYSVRGNIVIDRARAFRDFTCDEIVAAVPQNTKERLQPNVTPWFAFDVGIDANESIQLLTKCVRAAVSTKLRLLGTDQATRFAGSLGADTGKVQVLKATFDLQKAEVSFDPAIAFDPRLDIQMTSQIEGYQVFMNLDGYSSAPRTSFWSEPSTTPWGTPIGQIEILRMVASGRAPKAESGGGNALASQVANYVYGSTALDESISKAFSKLTAGFVDSVRLQPIIENGQTAWKASLNRSVGERFNLGLDVEQSPLVNNQSLTGTLYLNQSVNVLGGFDRKANQAESYYEFSGGLRFMFGGK